VSLPGSSHLLHAALLAVSPSPSPKAKEPDPDTVSPGLIGLLFLVLLAVATFFLARSLITQLKRVDFDEDAASARLRGEPPVTADVVDDAVVTDSSTAVDGDSPNLPTS
jgi:hypothetical protein